MKTRSSLQVAVLVCAALALSVTSSLAQPADVEGVPSGPTMANKRMGNGGHMRKLLEQLDLTTEQKKAIDANMLSHRDEEHALRQEIGQRRKLLRQELEKPQLDRNKVQTLHNEMKVLLMKKEDLRLDRILTVHDILEPDQLQKFQAIMKEKKEQFNEKRKNFKGKKV